MLLQRHLSRRRLLGAGVALASASALGFTCIPPEPWPPIPKRERTTGPRHLSWVWQFTQDGPPDVIAAVLARYNLGILLKTHDGTDWMSRYDLSPYSVSGPGQVGVLANFFESFGIPFHAWCLVKGLDPLREAAMAADVAAAGARSVTIDLEPHSGFWQGTREGAIAFVREFRRRQPNAELIVSIDPRPWALARVPFREFAAPAQGVAPQLYWETFNTSGNIRRYEESGYPPGDRGITPEFLVTTTTKILGPYGRPVIPAGQGNSTAEAWGDFLGASRSAGLQFVSTWRHGVTATSIYELLKSGVAPPPTAPTPTPSPPVPLSIGATAKVVNTGDCLNVREAPTVSAAIVTCLADGNLVLIKAGPVQNGGRRWWQVQTQSVTGWSAEADLDGTPWLSPI